MRIAVPVLLVLGCTSGSDTPAPAGAGDSEYGTAPGSPHGVVFSRP